MVSPLSLFVLLAALAAPVLGQDAGGDTSADPAPDAAPEETVAAAAAAKGSGTPPPPAGSASEAPPAEATAEAFRRFRYTEIHPYGNRRKCLDVRGAHFANGTPVQIYDCNGTNAQRFVLTHGNTAVRVYGTNYCLDAGSYPGNGVGMKIWQCYDNLPAQQWYYTPRNGHLNLRNTNQCLDLPGGQLYNGNQVQTWQCYAGNRNQIWTTNFPV